ncbi:uncharacterized protein LOC134648429 [Cydia amplana]|uniref:uncharacterized protein LOC134648429 n=1 Tax=Cydia amplana TaxID=1869771 RepID=UPI002FE558FA
METACLKIKFTSLIKKLRENDSKCCLEIVPEVTCLQNFDKMLQRQENSLYEYAIPITYKIILKKCIKCDTKHTGFELNQIYHSCVDIFHAPATSYIDETGDIKPFSSETVLFNKLPSSHGWNMAVPQHNKLNSTPEEKNTASTQTYEKRGEFTLTSSKNRNLNKYYTTNSTDDTGKEYCVSVSRDIDIQVNSMQNIVDMANGIPEKGNQKTRNKNINFSINEISKKCNINEMRKLSLTPICSINTNDMFMAEQNGNIRIRNYIDKDNNRRCFKDVVLYNYRSQIIKPNMDTTYMPLNEYKPIEPYRNTPEVRIAEFQKLIESEMLPLKHMLNDIVSKYMSLNVDNQLKKSLLLGTKKYHQIEKFTCQNRPKSNRVFYTIVFDG